jgi:high-affinity Fe2+/Pb2+ permease
MVLVLGLVVSLLASVFLYLVAAGIQNTAARGLIGLLVFLVVLGATPAFHEKSRAWIMRQSDKSLFRHSLVVILPLGLLAVITVVLGFIFTWSDRAGRPIMFEASLAVLGGVGAAIALVVNYRRQKVFESETLTKRFSDFTNQLADDKPPVNLAGVYSLFRLADEWQDQRQQIIDVLCATLPNSPLAGGYT